MSTIRQVGNFENDEGLRLLYEVVEELHQFIAYSIAEENRGMLGGQESDLIAAIDMLALMAEHYGIHPGVDVLTVRRWCSILLPLFDAANDFNPSGNTSSWVYGRHNVILTTFARLEAVVKLYSRNNSWEEMEES